MFELIILFAGYIYIAGFLFTEGLFVSEFSHDQNKQFIPLVLFTLAIFFLWPLFIGFMAFMYYREIRMLNTNKDARRIYVYDPE